jgi:hypothetical protein
MVVFVKDAAEAVSEADALWLAYFFQVCDLDAAGRFIALYPMYLMDPWPDLV